MEILSAQKRPGGQASDNDIFSVARDQPEPEKPAKPNDVHIKKADRGEICRLACSQAMNARGWRNFMRRRDGSLEFGKLAMQKVDPVTINCQRSWVQLRFAAP